MRRTNKSKNEEPIRTPIVRPQDISSFSSDNRIKGNTQNIPQMSYSLSVKEEEEEEEKDEDIKANDLSETNPQFLSIPRVKVQTPPVQSSRVRSQSVPSFENKILMDYCLIKSINNKANEDLITVSSRHLSFHSPSESSPSTTLHNKIYEGPNVANPAKKGHHSERESPNSSTFFKNNDKLEKSKRIWSTLDEDHSKSYRKQTLNSQIKSYSQRPATPFETKELRKASPTSLKEINDDIEEIQIIETNKNLSSNKTAGSENISKKFSKNFPLFGKFNFNKNEANY